MKKSEIIVKLRLQLNAIKDLQNRVEALEKLESEPKEPKDGQYKIGDSEDLSWMRDQESENVVPSEEDINTASIDYYEFEDYQVSKEFRSREAFKAGVKWALEYKK